MMELSVFLRHAKRNNKKELDLSNRQLSFIPKEVFSMQKLEELNLSDNKIAVIEPEIKELFRLKVLNLDNNVITDLP
jgi:Leucine-rich repeat (LRR) protein